MASNSRRATNTTTTGSTNAAITTNPAKRSASTAGLTSSRPPSRLQNNGLNGRKPLSSASPNTGGIGFTAPTAAAGQLKPASKQPSVLKASLGNHGGGGLAPTARPATLVHAKYASTGSIPSRATTGSGNNLESGSEAALNSSGSGDTSQGNIKVVVRCRGANRRELAESSELCISTSATRGNEVSISSSSVPFSLPSSQPQSTASSLLLPMLGRNDEVPSGKLYNFDNVFGEQADQAMLYADVVQPILDEVLLGYNCTIFAYGQTGTGKTYTMEGDLTPSPLGTFSPEAGVIPRTLHRLFHMLEGSEFTVRVSFIELYNEDLRDLNVSDAAFASQSSSAEDNASSPLLKIFDDSSRKGGVVIQGLEETHIQSANAGIKILTRGSQRRQIASTKCNDQSSRSHSIFSITVHLKEVSNKGEDLLKVGKLNLVDLAGSENVGRSGAKDGRAREAGMINQSLLTLGRVINALVEKSPHVPYRESKLTRLLQDSLGGRTKTCIIATISPARINLEETMSTLDYAARAKSIRNKPEVNSRMTKAALLSQYSIEIERLKADVLAAREKNGIYLSDESWAEISAEHDSRKGQLNEAKRQADIFQSQMRTTKEQFEQALRVLGVRDGELKNLNEQLELRLGSLKDLQGLLQDTQKELEEEMSLRKANHEERRRWKQVAGQAVDDVAGLRQKLQRKAMVEDKNAGTVKHAHGSLGSTTQGLLEHLTNFQQKHEAYTTTSENIVKAMTDKQLEAISSNHTFVEEQLALLLASSTSVRSKLQAQDIQLSSFLQLVESTSQDILVQSQQQQAQALQTAREMCEAVQRGCGEVLKEADGALRKVLQSVAEMHASAKSQLQKQADSARVKKEAEQKSLQEENDRLRAQNEALSRLLLEQRQSASRWQTEFLASLTSNITAFNASQDDLLQRNIGSVQASLVEGMAIRTKKGKAREAAFGELAKGFDNVYSDIAERTSGIQQAASLHNEMSNKTAQTLYLDLNTRNVAMSASFEAQSRSTQQGVDLLQRHCEKFEEARINHGASVLEDLDGLVGDAEETYRDIQEDLTECSEELRTKYAEMSEAASQYTNSAEQYFTSASTDLSTLHAGLDLHLQHNIATDLPTGLTPQKRSWPEALAADIEDPLDAEDRRAILEHLMRQQDAAASELGEEDGEGDRLEEMRSGPRVSNTLAARKAARRSSMMKT